MTFMPTFSAFNVMQIVVIVNVVLLSVVMLSVNAPQKLPSKIKDAFID
jgi:hypothetical protein